MQIFTLVLIVWVRFFTVVIISDEEYVLVESKRYYKIENEYD